MVDAAWVLTGSTRQCFRAAASYAAGDASETVLQVVNLAELEPMMKAGAAVFGIVSPLAAHFCSFAEPARSTCNCAAAAQVSAAAQFERPNLALNAAEHLCGAGHRHRWCAHADGCRHPQNAPARLHGRCGHTGS